jgi:DNA-binding Lrp family transcriptional regulator
MTPLEFRLLDEFQRGFPLVPEPYVALAETLGVAESEVLASLARLQSDGAVSRIGAVFRPGAIGASTLAAMSVPAPRLDRVAAIVSACPQVSHNYERENDFNLWFVATAPEQASLDGLLRRIVTATGHAVVSLPLVEEYHIDLGFRLHGEPTATPPRVCGAHRPARAELDAGERRLAAELASGLALQSGPYAELGRRAGLAEATVLGTLARWQACGIVRRFGVVVRHRELGYGANAMAVWDVDDERIGAAGERLAREPHVTLAYRRARARPAWPYNLYCMVHGHHRDDVVGVMAAAAKRAGVADAPHAMLFSRRRFKQVAARMPARWRDPAWTPSIA